MLNRLAPPRAAPSSEPHRACSAARPGARPHRACSAARPRAPDRRGLAGWALPRGARSPPHPAQAAPRTLAPRDVPEPRARGVSARRTGSQPRRAPLPRSVPARVHLSARACSVRGGSPAAGTCGRRLPRGPCLHPPASPGAALRSASCPRRQRRVPAGVSTALAGLCASCVGRRGSHAGAGVDARAPRGPQDPSQLEPFPGAAPVLRSRPELAAGGTRGRPRAGPSGSACRRVGPPRVLGLFRSWPGDPPHLVSLRSRTAARAPGRGSTRSLCPFSCGSGP